MLKAKWEPQGEDKHEDKDKDEDQDWPFEAPNPVAPALPMLALAELCGQDTGVIELESLRLGCRPRSLAEQ